MARHGDWHTMFMHVRWQARNVEGILSVWKFQGKVPLPVVVRLNNCNHVIRSQLTTWSISLCPVWVLSLCYCTAHSNQTLGHMLVQCRLVHYQLYSQHCWQKPGRGFFPGNFVIMRKKYRNIKGRSAICQILPRLQGYECFSQACQINQFLISKWLCLVRRSKIKDRLRCMEQKDAQYKADAFYQVINGEITTTVPIKTVWM